jgi:hypothetical protein
MAYVATAGLWRLILFALSLTSPASYTIRILQPPHEKVHNPCQIITILLNLDGRERRQLLMDLFMQN